MARRLSLASIPLTADIGHLDVVEDEAYGLETRLQATLETGAVELLHAATLDHVGPHARRDVPDVREGDGCELTSPAHGQRDAAEDGHEVVAAQLPAVEAFVRAGPHAVDGVGAIGLAQHLVETHLDMVVQVVGVSVREINFLLRHGCCCW